MIINKCFFFLKLLQEKTLFENSIIISFHDYYQSYHASRVVPIDAELKLCAVLRRLGIHQEKRKKKMKIDRSSH